MRLFILFLVMGPFVSLLKFLKFVGLKLSLWWFILRAGIVFRLSGSSTIIVHKENISHASHMYILSLMYLDFTYYERNDTYI
jgi:hypothetical protein